MSSSDYGAGWDAGTVALKVRALAAAVAILCLITAYLVVRLRSSDGGDYRGPLARMLAGNEPLGVTDGNRQAENPGVTRENPHTDVLPRVPASRQAT